MIIRYYLDFIFERYLFSLKSFLKIFILASVMFGMLKYYTSNLNLHRLLIGARNFSE